MIAAWMVFVLTVSAVAAGAAWLADAGLRRLGRPSRGVWLAAMWAPVGVLAALALPLADQLPVWGSGADGVAVDALPLVELPGLVVGPGGAGVGWVGGLLGVAWLLASAVLATVLVQAHRRLRRERAGWTRTTLLGQETWISPDRGPAVAGAVRPWMMLPEWVLDLPAEELRMVVAHESEHLRSRDPLLLSAGWWALTLAPWNPVAWWQLRRLRSAMEVDCDRRVLARLPDPWAYGFSLLAVAKRASRSSLALAAFSERPSNLERRIQTMTQRTSTTTRIVGVLLLLGAVGVGVQACGVDSPVAPEVDPERSETIVPEGIPDDSPEPPESALDDLAAEPTFTPFTIAPSIANRSEVVEAMEDEYPPLLREAGVGGTVRVYFLIDSDGVVTRRLIDQSSGHEALDRAALNVADTYRFSPAMNAGDPVPVWVSFPITFRVGGPPS